MAGQGRWGCEVSPAASRTSLSILSVSRQKSASTPFTLDRSSLRGMTSSLSHWEISHWAFSSDGPLSGTRRVMNTFGLAGVLMALWQTTTSFRQLATRLLSEQRLTRKPSCVILIVLASKVAKLVGKGT